MAIGVEIKSESFFYARVYDRYFIAQTEDMVVRMIEDFEEEVWPKTKRLQSWVVFEIDLVEAAYRPGTHGVGIGVDNER